VVSNVIINVAKKDILETKEFNKTKKIDEKISSNKNQLPRIFEMEAGTSGRITLWKNALERYEKNRFFGYGPQGDRILLINQINVYGNNVSNAMIYALLSGGYFSFLIIILIYFYTAYMILKFFLINKIFYNKLKLNKENIFVVASLVYAVFFMVRSLFENSFGVFSIDFLIVILSLFIVENQTSKNINFKFLKSYL
jgi:O-antigen ligase